MAKAALPLETAAPVLGANAPPDTHLALRGIAHAAIDLSDGLAGDLGHVLRQSQVGACLQADALPVGPMLSRQTLAVQRSFALGGGDDYELCFTAPAAVRAKVLAAGLAADVAVTRIGAIESMPGLRLRDADNAILHWQPTSFDHFGTP